MGLGTITKTGSNVAREVRRAFGDEASVQITDEDLLGWVNDGITEIAQKLKINRKRGLTDIVNGQSIYPFAEIEILQIESLMVDNVLINGLEYQEAELELFVTDPYNEQYGRTKYWYVAENNINLWPIPDFDSSNGLCILYIAAPGRLSALTESLTIPDKHFTALTSYVLAQAYQLDEDPEWFTLKMQQFTSALDGQLDEDKTTITRSFPSILETQGF